MGKQAKPKAANLKGKQRKHNPLTRWLNDVRRKPDLLWDWSLLHDAVEEKLPNGETKTFLVKKDFNDLKNRLHEPLDDLLLDWETEIQHYAVENHGKIERTPTATGGTKYTVYIEYAGIGTKVHRKVLLELETPRSFVSFSPKRQKRKGQQQKKEEAATPTSN
jgi:hypothetical protein